MNNFKPYSYQPKYTAQEVAEREVRAQDEARVMAERAGNTEWCKCGNCVVMSTAKECICCLDNVNILQLLEQCSLQDQCVLEHGSFEAVVLNTCSLNTKRHDLIKMGLDVNEKKKLSNLSNRLWRHLAYRKFVDWINSWTTLGRFNRIVIPSCVVNRVRQEFPDPAGNYVGFQSVTPSSMANLPD